MGFYLFLCLCDSYVLGGFLDYISFQKASGSSCANAKSRCRKTPMLKGCTRGKWFLAQRAPRGRLSYVVARGVAGVTLVWWRQIQDSDKTEKVRQNPCFSMFLCSPFYVSNWYDDNVCPSRSLFENQCLRFFAEWIHSKELPFFLSYHISRYLSFLTKILTFRCLKQPVKIA